MGGACLIVGLIIGQTGLLVRDHLRIANAADNGIQSKSIVSDSVAAQLLTAKSTDGEPVSASIVSWRPLDQAATGNGADLGIGTNGLEFDTKSRNQTDFANQTVESISASISDTPQTLSTIDDTRAEVTVDQPREGVMVTASVNHPPPVENAGEDLQTREPIAADSSLVIDSLEMLASPTKNVHPLCEDGTCQQRMESLGTTLKWADSPRDAYRMAGEQDKLVFLIHVSGNFEIPGFT